MAKKTDEIALRPAAITFSESEIGRELKSLDSKGKAPRNRLRDARALHSLWITLITADKRSAYNRVILQEMLDGTPPQKDSILRQVGRSWEYNLNFLEADARMSAALTSYDDLVDSVESLISPELEPRSVPDEDVNDIVDIIGEEFTRLVREDSDFYFNWQRLASEFVGHGVGFAFFPDNDTWKWEPAGWDEMKMPRKTPAKDEAVTMLIWRKAYRAHELYEKIEAGKDNSPGWDEEEVQKAIVTASKGRSKLRRWYDYWPFVEQELKNNDYGFSLGDCEEIETIQSIVREFDGSYSFYIGLEDGTNTNYLYQDKNRYTKANEAFISFTLGVGNGTFHSIRGLLWKMFPGVQARNRMFCGLLNQTTVAMSMILQPQDGESLDDMSLTFMGAFASLSPGVNVIENKFPDVGTQALPVIRETGMILDNATGQFQAISAQSQPQSQPGANGDKSKYQFQSEQEHTASLSSNSVDRFSHSLDKLCNEQFRRVQKISTKSDKFPEVAAFYSRCAERGVDPQVIKKSVRRVTAVRAIGNGSPQMRQLALDELNQMSGALDETGRNLAARDRIALRFGRAAADRYLPKQRRVAPDAQLAVVENAALHNDSIPVLPGQNHAVHASIHIPKLLDGVKQLVAARDQNPEGDFTTTRPMLQYLFAMHEHSGQHVSALAADPSRADDMKSYTAALEQSGNLLQAYGRTVQQQERQKQEEAEEAQGQAQDPTIQLRASREQQGMQHDQESHQADMAIKQAHLQKIQTETAAVGSQVQHTIQLQDQESAVHTDIKRHESAAHVEIKHKESAAKIAANKSAKSGASKG